jgi:hypothetical protein
MHAINQSINQLTHSFINAFTNAGHGRARLPAQVHIARRSHLVIE